MRPDPDDQAADRPAPVPEPAPPQPQPPRRRPRTKSDATWADVLVRSGLAVAAIGLFLVVFLVSFFRADTAAQQNEVLDRLLPILSLLIGGIIGYYFAKDR